MGQDRPDVKSYLRLPDPEEDISFDLSAGYRELYQFHSFGYDGINYVLEFLAQKPQLLEGVDFVTRRGILLNIMRVVTENKEDVQFLATRVNGVIYLSDVYRGPNRPQKSNFQWLKVLKYLFSGEDPFCRQSNIELNGNVCPLYPQ